MAPTKRRKRCSICKERKPRLEFNLRRASRDGRQSHCRACNRDASRSYYAKNREKHQRVIRARTDQLIESNRRFIFEYFSSHSCVDCGEDDPVVLEFDHVRGEKKAPVSRLISYSLRTVKCEIAKCLVRCANCHRRKTAADFGWYKDLLA